MTTAKTSEKKEKFRRVDVSQTTETASPSAFNIKKEFADLTLPLSTKEYQGLRGLVSDAGKVLMPILVDETMTVLDGHHRLKIALDLGLEKIPYRVKKGLSSQEKIECVYVENESRRHSSRDQQKESYKNRLQNLLTLHQQNPSDWPIEKIADLVGKPIETIRDRLKGQGVDVPDRRTKLTKQEREEIKKLVASKKPYEQIAADFGVSKGLITQIAKPKHRKTTAKPAIKDPGATGPFVESWPTEKIQERSFLNRIKNACSGCEMAVAVVPVALVDDVRSLIDPQDQQMPDECQEACEREWDSDFDESEGSEDEWDDAKDEDMQSITELCGNADDEEDDE